MDTIHQGLVSGADLQSGEHLFFSDRTLKAIEGKEPLAQLELLREAVERAEREKLAGYGPPEDDINIVRRRFIRIASELYRGARHDAS